MGYSSNMSVQMLIALLKRHKINRIIASPGTTNLEFVAGLQYDDYFEIYSAIDERSAAYMACGMVAEGGEPVVITCTEATASRDYYPALTEAYYRKLPVLAVTGVHKYAQIGQLQPQIIDRSISPKDVFKLKVHLPIIHDQEDIWESEVKINRALLELKRPSSGPVHIDLPCCGDNYDFSIQELPKVRVIKRYYEGMSFPVLPKGKIAIFAGSHIRFHDDLTEALDNFCATYDAVVFCDHTSGYYGKYRVQTNLLALQKASYDIFDNIAVLIHIGEATGDEQSMNRLTKAEQVWRVNPDGELRDTFKKLTTVFEMNETVFFNYYGKTGVEEKNSYLLRCKQYLKNLSIPIEELPFSNIYAAARISSHLPEKSVVHLGVSNTIRAWSMFEFPKSVTSNSNVGCRGIDGTLSTFIGASLVDHTRLYFCVLGDLTFFYDMNVLGNRFVGNNVRILLINNNGGAIFKLTNAPGHRFFGDSVTDEYIAASGHFGNQSKILVKNYAEALGFEYLKAESRKEFDALYEHFLIPKMLDKPVLFELFTKDFDERDAFYTMSNIEISAVGKATQIAKQILGEKGTQFVKKYLK